MLFALLATQVGTGEAAEPPRPSPDDESGSGAAVLREALPGLTGDARLRAIRRLGDQRDAASVNLLVPLASDADGDVAEAAVVALGKIASIEARQALAALRETAPFARQAWVIEGQLRGAEQLADDGDLAGAIALYESLLNSDLPVHVARGAFGALLQLDADGRWDRVMTVLERADPVLLPVAITAAGSLEQADASARLGAVLPKLDPRAQVWLINSLAQRGDADAHRAILGRLSDPDATVRIAAIQALGRTGDVLLIPDLVRALKGPPDRSVRQAVESVLTQMPADAVVDEVIGVELEHAPNAVKPVLMAVAVRREWMGAMPILLRLMRDPDLAVARAATQSIGKLGPSAEIVVLVQALIEPCREELRLDLEQAIAQGLIGGGHPGRVFEAFAAMRDTRSRCSLLRLMPAIAASDRTSKVFADRYGLVPYAEQALHAVQHATEAADPAVQDAALRALADWPRLEAWDALMAVYRQPPQPVYGIMALRGLVRLVAEADTEPKPELLDRYRDLLGGARREDDYRLILGALARVADLEALRLALAHVQTPGIQAEAALAIRQIADAIRDQYPQAAAEALQQLTK